MKLSDQVKVLMDERRQLKQRLQEIESELSSITQVMDAGRPPPTRKKLVTQKAVLDAIQEIGPIKAIALADKFGWSRAVTQQHLSRLKSLGKAINKNSEWSVLKEEPPPPLQVFETQ